MVEKSGVKADVSTVASLEPVIDGENLRLRVHIESLVPQIDWWFFNFQIRGFVRDLVQVKLTEELNKADALGAIVVPLSRESAFEIPSSTTPFTVTGVTGHITAPTYSLRMRTKVDKIICLPDGLHLFASVE